MIKLTEILQDIIAEKKLCKKGKAYYNRRRAAGEKPSAYLSGRAVKVCKGLMEEDDLDLHESLRDWFKKEDWVRIDTAGNITGPCLLEAEYRGRKVTLGKPMRGDIKKFKVYVKNNKGKVVKVNFGFGGKSAKGKRMHIKVNQYLLLHLLPSATQNLQLAHIEPPLVTRIPGWWSAGYSAGPSFSINSDSLIIIYYFLNQIH